MSDSNSVNDILETKNPVEAVVEYTSDGKKAQKEKAVSEGNDGLAK